MMSPRHSIAPQESYAALFSGALGTLPGAGEPRVRRWREANFERFRTLGFPGPRSEAWKYTSLAPLTRLELALPHPVEVARAQLEPFLIKGKGVRHLVFVNGVFAARLSDPMSAAAADGVRVSRLADALERGGDDLLELSPVQGGERAFSALNEAFATDGCLIELAPGAAPPAPVQLLFVTTSGRAPWLVSPRNVFALAHGAALDLIETHVTLGASEGLTNLVNTFEIGRGAVLRHDRLQFGDISGHHIGRNQYRLSADARLTQGLATLGGGLVRNEIEAVLDGAGVDVDFNGLYLTRERQHVDNTIVIEHAQPRSESNQFYKGVLDGRSRAAFAGKIVVRRPAQKTNAYQSNKNLVLSPDAEINTKPELEIYADDVKCSHGATAGELDERELFYLRSRGLDPASARSILIYAFAEEVLQRFASKDAGRQARRELLRWLPGGGELGELA